MIITINRMTGPDCAVMCNSIKTRTHVTPEKGDAFKCDP